MSDFIFKHLAGAGCGTFLILMGIFAIIMAFLTSWTQGNLEWILSACTGHPVHIQWLLVLILNILCNFFALLFNIICEILKCAII